MTICKFQSPEDCQAFRNVERTLATGGGWEHVVHAILPCWRVSKEVNEVMVKLFRHYMPNHAPLWTEVGVAALGCQRCEQTALLQLFREFRTSGNGHCEVRSHLLSGIENPSLFILNQGELAQMESMKAVLTAFGDAEKFEIQTPYQH